MSGQASLDFAKDLLSDLEDLVDEGGSLTMEDALTKQAMEYLLEEGIIEAMDPAYIRLENKRPHRRMNAWGISDDGQTLVVMVTHLDDSLEGNRIYKDECERLLRQAQAVAEDALNGKAGTWQVERNQEAVLAAEAIHEAADGVTRVNIVLATNSLVARDWELESFEDDGRTWQPRIIDLDRFWRFNRGDDPERIQLDLEANYQKIPFVESQQGSLRVLLCVMPGDLLADVYERYGIQLMESNVRAYLQARGYVNKGIRTTILHEPDMFVTYNNGIACTATHVSVDAEARMLTGIDDLQIVNGGQTTASLFHARLKDKADLSGIAVPVKITVITDKTEAERIVPNISRYSNTQNQVNLADFHSNDPFHLAMFQASQAVSVPDPAGGRKETFWFYERSRGLFEEKRAKEGTAARRKKFNQLFPTKQRIQKAHLAKALNAWDRTPRQVALGLQKNFNEFSIRIQKDPPTVTDDFFREAIAKWILFRRADRVIQQNLGGTFKAPILAYTVALFSEAVNAHLPWTDIWREQALPDIVEEEILRVGTVVHRHITEPQHEKIKNPGEWAKKPECWDTLLKRGYECDAEFLAGYRALCGQNRASRTPRNFSAEDSTIPGRVFLDLTRWMRKQGGYPSKVTSALRDYGRALARGGAPESLSVGAAGEHLLEALDEGFTSTYLPKRTELEIRRRFE